MSHAFISYSRSDLEYVTGLADYIQAAGLEVFYDQDIDYSSQWWSTIVERIRACGAVIVVMTPDLEASDWVVKEILLARREDKKVFPLLLSGTGYPLLIDVQYVDVTGGALPPDDFVETLRLAVSADVNAEPASTTTEPAPVPEHPIDAISVAPESSPDDNAISRGSVSGTTQRPGDRSAIASGLNLDALAAVVERAEETILACERAEEEGNVTAHLLTTKADALSTLHRPKESKKASDRALELEPNNLDALALRGDALADLDKNKKALRDLDQVLAIDPDHRVALIAKAGMLSDSDKEEALALVDHQLSLNPSDGDALAVKALIHALADDLNLADELSRLALGLQPGSDTAWFARVFVNIGREKLDEASEIIEALVLIFPQSPIALSTSAIVQAATVLSQDDAGEADYRRLAATAKRTLKTLPRSKGPLALNAHLCLAVAHAGLGHPDKAIEEIQTAESMAKTDQDRANVNNFRAAVELKLDRPFAAMWSRFRGWLSEP